MNWIENHRAIVPVDTSSSPTPTPTSARQPAGQPAGRRAAASASLQGLAKRATQGQLAEHGTKAARVAPPRAGLPKANRHGAGRAEPDGEVPQSDEASKPDRHQHASAASQKPGQPKSADRKSHDAEHAEHAEHHAAQLAAAKARHDRLRRLSDFKKRLVVHKSSVLTKLVGG